MQLVAAWFPDQGSNPCTPAMDQGSPRLYQSFPAEDVAVEADPVFGEVEAALKKNVSLECTGVIWSRLWEMELRDREASQ